MYDRTIEGYRTQRVNEFFGLISRLSGSHDKQKSGEISVETNLSASVDIKVELSNSFIEDFIACVELSKKINERV